jgi:crotonobetainyl-CoA:carnitine CoA-transferase CaiB-like acyl-CoA transferase
MDQPLQGLRVIEFCNVAAGPYCGMLLADLGAEVIKVEHPDGGDTLRSWPPISTPEDGSAEGFSENFASLNRNKKSVCLDLKSEDGAAAARALLRDAHVLIENNRPGVMERLGLGYETVREANKAIVYCSISAYGQTGPRRGEGGFDLTVQAMSGLMSITGEQGRPPVKCGVPVADFTAGLYGAFCIAAAVRAAEHTGEGTHIDVPMLGATLAIAALQTSEYFGTGRDPVRLGSAHPRNAPYRSFRSSRRCSRMRASKIGWHVSAPPEFHARRSTPIRRHSRIRRWRTWVGWRTSVYQTASRPAASGRRCVSPPMNAWRLVRRRFSARIRTLSWSPSRESSDGQHRRQGLQRPRGPGQ